MRPKKVSKKSNFSVYLARRRYIFKLRSGERLFASWVSREKERQYKFAQKAERQLDITLQEYFETNQQF